MKKLIILLALCGCPKQQAEPVKDATIEDARVGEDHVVMDAVVIESGSRPD